MKLIGVEAGGRSEQLGEHAARFRGGAPGVLQARTAICCRMRTARSSLTHSVSAGLDYASVGPEHAWLHDQGRAEYCLGDAMREALDGGASCWRAPRASFRRSNRRTRSPKRSGARRPRRARSSS